MIFSAYSVRLEEVSQVSSPVSCHLSSLMQVHRSLGKCFLNLSMHLNHLGPCRFWVSQAAVGLRISMSS